MAALISGVQLAGNPKPDGTATLSRYVDVGVSVQAHRSAVESVSVLFELYAGDAASCTASGLPGDQRLTGRQGAHSYAGIPTRPKRKVEGR